VSLPVEQVLADVQSALSQHQQAILVAPPGAGKTTRVPLYLLEQLQSSGNGRILLLEPRRLAVKNTAEFLAQQLGEACGKRVGYRMRQDSKVSSQTRLEVITEGVMLRLLQEDPSLEGIDTIIFDEFHERSLAADLSLSLCLQTNQLFREHEPINLLIMSATLDTKKLEQLLPDTPLIISEGRQFPISYHYLSHTPAPHERLDTWADSVEQALTDQAGNLLVFLPGQRDIERLAERLQHLQSDKLQILPLYGRLTLAEQRQAIAAPAAGQRKIVLATNVAETSLTIEGISCVIDTGLEKQAIFEPGSGLTRLHTRTISAASATQRAGRAGRLQAGHCYRQWSQSQQDGLAQQALPAIKQSDLSGLVMQLLACGYGHMDELDWLDKPSAGAWQQAVDLLRLLDAVEQQNHGLSLTSHGEFLAASGQEPRLAQLLIKAIPQGLITPACNLISLLEQPHPNMPADLDLALSKPLTQQQKRTSQQLQQRCQKLVKEITANTSKQTLVQCLAQAWPDRIGQKQNASSQDGKINYKLSNGRGVELAWSADINKAPTYIVVTNTFASQQAKRDQIANYIAIDEIDLQAALAAHIEQKITCEWQQQADRLALFEAQTLGQLILKQQATNKVDANAKAAALCHYLANKDLTPLPWNEACQQWLARLRLAHDHAPKDNNPWPDLSHSWLTQHIDDWLGPYVDNISSGAQLAKLDLLSILQNQLDYSLQQQLNQLAPERLQVPSGNQHRIDYSQSPPVLAVKLQELFGLQEVPKVAYDVAVQIHLLSPAGRPLAVTQDLANFWRNAYTDVKKEMKGRYPKHPWPDDPLTAVATAKTKRHL
jgi:ATP-dependent helicase HrpB